MVLRTVKTAGGEGVQHEHMRLVESYRQDGKTKQRIVCDLGRKDVLVERLDSLIRLLRGDRGVVLPGGAVQVQATGA